MHLDNGRVQADSLDAHVHQAPALQLLKQRIEYAGFGPAAHAHVYGVPGAVVAGQRAPLGKPLAATYKMALTTWKFCSRTLPR